VLLAAAALGGGCGPKGGKTIGNTPSDSGKARVECPTGDALTAAARTYLAGGASADGDVSAACVAVYTDRPLWVLGGYHASPTEDGIALVTALVDPVTNKAVWTTGAGDFAFPPGAIDRMSGPGMSAVDLDGDGRDEIVNISGTSAQGYDVESLAIMTIGRDGLVPAGEIPFLEDNSAAEPDPDQLQSCSTEWKLVAGPEGSKLLDLVVTAEPAGRESSCLTVGHHVMKWTGQALVDTL
jgi:hypothetical protein